MNLPRNPHRFTSFHTAIPESERNCSKWALTSRRLFSLAAGSNCDPNHGSGGFSKKQH